jgi:hypothetical protein
MAVPLPGVTMDWQRQSPQVRAINKPRATYAHNVSDRDCYG